MFETLRNRFTDGGETRTDGGDTGFGAITKTDSSTESATTDSAAAGPGSPGRAEEATTSDDEVPAIGLDEIFGVLKNRRRRDVLRYLTAESGQVRIGELSERIAARECDKPVSRVDSGERKRVYVALYQCHLPRMAEVGAVSYNQPRGTVERGPNVDLFEQYLPEEEGPVAVTRSGFGPLPSLSALVERIRSRRP